MASTEEANNLPVSFIKEGKVLMEQLKLCHKYFQQSADIASLLADVPTFYEHLRILINYMQKISVELELELHMKEIIQEISISLLRINASCSLQLDGQLLCSIAFSSALCKVLKYDKLNVLLSSYLSSNDYVCIEFNNVSYAMYVENLEMFKLCLCHGILQSNVLTTILQGYEDGNNLPFIMFNLLEELCMKYSKVTCISFKILMTWINKVCLDFKLILSTDYLRRIFSLINSNWENPIHGVREQNARMFELFLDVCSLNSLENSNSDSVFKSIRNLMCHVMREQSWKMKSKYSMISLLLQKYGARKGFEEFPNLVYGLVSSLSHSHLTTAGSEMYRSCLKSLHFDEWLDIFLTPIIKIMTDKKDIVSIEKQNLFNYWIPVTVKKFPSLLNMLLQQLINVSDFTHYENMVFSIISLLKLGRKRGALLSVWNKESAIGILTFHDFLNLLQCALEHSSEIIRAEAFAVVCCSTKTSVIPSVTEFELVQKFLLNNVNIDSALLRQSVLNSFTLFMIRILDSSLFEIDVRNKQDINEQIHEFSSSETVTNCSTNDILQNVNFLEWLYYFLILNLQPGVNYQRRILSLQLFKISLTYFGETSEEIKHKLGIKRKGIDRSKRERVVRYALKLGKCHFNCTRSCRTILSCVLDPTDDIREIASLILMEHFNLQHIIQDYKGLLDFALKLCSSPVFYETESGALLFKVIANWTYKISENIFHEFISNIREIKCEKSVEITEDQTDYKCKMNTNKNSESCLVLNDQEKLMAALLQVVNKSSEGNDLKLVAGISVVTDRNDSSNELSLTRITDSIELHEENLTVGVCTCSQTYEAASFFKKGNDDAIEYLSFKEVKHECHGDIASQRECEIKEKSGSIKTYPNNSLLCSDSVKSSIIGSEKTPRINTSDGFHKSYVEENVTEEDIYKSNAPLSLFLLSEAEKQFNHLKNDIFQAVTSGFPLYGILAALAQLSTDVNGAEFGCMSTMEVDRTVSLLEETVSYLLDLLAVKSTTNKDAAPSFAEMDQAIKFSIHKSTICLETAEEKNMHLSPAHQLILNCVWRNLRICCTLASGLPCNKKCNIEAVKRCANLITQILTRCRHKGAIESAGVALSIFVKTVTIYHTFNQDLHLILRDLLQQFLQSFERSSGKGSVTRCSAGLSILVQKIVTSDTQPDKPLLRMCITRLLDIASAPIESKIVADPEAVLTDLPQAQSLHFLRILVQDSSLKQDIAQYMSSIAIVCFTHFTSSLWTIRNAALQLSGTLIPKLVGQKKIQDEEVTLGSNISVESFFSHFPELTDFILIYLKKAANCHHSQALQQHADLIPMLSLLAKVTIGIETFINTSLINKICQCCDCFLQLLGSPIYHVRKLGAKAYERYIPLTNTYETIVCLIKKLNRNSIDDSYLYEQNKLNGILMAVKYLVEKLKFESENTTEMESYLLNISTLLKNVVKDDMLCDICTYFNKLLFIELMEYVNIEIVAYNHDYVYERILEVNRILEQEKITPSFKPGLYLWAAKVIEQLVKKCYPQHLVIIWYNTYVYFNTYPEITRSSFKSLKWRIETDENINRIAKSTLLIAIFKIVLKITNNHPFYTLSSLLDVMLLLLQDSETSFVVTLKDIETMASWCFKDNIITLPLVSGLLSHYLALKHSIGLSVFDLKFTLEHIKFIKNRSKAIEYDEDYRSNIAKSVNLLATSLRTTFVPALKMCEEDLRKEMLKDIIGILLNISLDLLQDEDHSVRKEAAKFISVCLVTVNEDMFRPLEQNPYSSLQNILQPPALLSLLPITYAIEFLWDKLCYADELEDLISCKVNRKLQVCNVTSPFDLRISNIYCEETKMIDLCGNSLLHILQEAKPLEKKKLKEIIYSRSLSFKDDVTSVISLLNTIQKCGIPSTSPEHKDVYIITKKIIYFSKLMTSLEMRNSDIESAIEDLKHLVAL